MGVIDFKQADTLSAVKEITLLAHEPLIAMIYRLINFFHRVMSCRRKNSEQPAIFVSRFYVIASENLINANEAPYLPVGEVLLVKLLKNANLPESTLTFAKGELIKMVEEKSEKELKECEN